MKGRQAAGARDALASVLAAEAAAYFSAHPRSPSAVRRPDIALRGEVFLVTLGDSLRHGVFGSGKTVEAALRSFDAAYLKMLRPPSLPSVPRRKQPPAPNDAWLRASAA